MPEKHTPGFVSQPDAGGDIANNIDPTDTAASQRLLSTDTIFEQDNSQDDVIDVSWQPIPDAIRYGGDRPPASPRLSSLQVAEPITVELESVEPDIGWLEPAIESPLIPAWGKRSQVSKPNDIKLELVPSAPRAAIPTNKKQATRKSSSKASTKNSKKRQRASPKSTSSSTDIERHINNYIVTDEDMKTAKEWLERAITKPHTKQQQQLTSSTQTQVEPLTALWAWLKGPTKTKTATKRKTNGSFWLDMAGELGAAGADYSGRWYFICERDPNEPDEMYFLRHWFMQVEFAEGTTEWSEQAFMEWVASLSAEERKIFAEAGGQIAGGHWQQHVTDGTSELIDTMRESRQRSSVDTAVNTFVNALLRLF